MALAGATSLPLPRLSRIGLVVEAHLRTYRRTWRASVATAIISPVLYLVGIGVGLGSLVDARSGAAALGGATYLEFLAPGLLAAGAMRVGTEEGAWPVMTGLKWRRTYNATLSTPAGVSDLAVGMVAWQVIRVLLAAVTFLLVAMLFGLTTPIGAVLALCPAVMTGAAFGAATIAYTSNLYSELALASLFRFGIVPIFLFSGTFFPISQLPAGAQPIAYVTPLWHGVELCRAAMLGGAPAWPAIAHVAYLALWIVAGLALSVHGLAKRLTP